MSVHLVAAKVHIFSKKDTIFFFIIFFLLNFANKNQ